MTLTVALVQYEGRADGRSARVEEMRRLLATVGSADLIVLPELWPTGYFRFDRYEAESEPLEGEVLDMLREVAQGRRTWIHGGSFVERGTSGRFHNTAVVVDPEGQIALRYQKMHVFGVDSLERELLTAGRVVSVARTPFGAMTTSTCYDLRFPELFRIAVAAGAEVIVVPAAWPAARTAHWRLLLRARAIENQCFVIACNAAGSDRGVELAGHSVVIDPWGEIVAEGGREHQILYAAIDPARVQAVRSEFPALSDMRPDLLPTPASSAGLLTEHSDR